MEAMKFPSWMFDEMRKKQDEIDAMLVRDAEQRLAADARLSMAAVRYIEEMVAAGVAPPRRYNQTLLEYQREATQAVVATEAGHRLFKKMRGVAKAASFASRYGGEGAFTTIGRISTGQNIHTLPIKKT